MTIQTITSPSGFEPHTTGSDRAPVGATGPNLATVYEFTIPVQEPAAIPANFTRIGDFVAELEAREGGRDVVRSARARASALLRGDGPATLRSMRLALGLSQAELAQIVGTSQPQIARIETGSHDPTYDTFERLAHALAVDVPDVVAAFREARNANRNA